MAVKEPRIKNNKLNILDFSLGIRAEEINDNFDLIRYWIESERLRMGGWGLVEGFELTRNLADFTIHVTSGLLINEHGEEVKVDEHTFHVGPPSYRTIVETVTADETGLLTLSYPMYSNRYHHVIYYLAGYEEDFTQEIKGTAVDTGQQISIGADVEWIAETKIKLTQRWANTEIRVEYLYAADRIDAVLVKKDGSEYKDPMPMGIISTSPSQQVIQEYFEQGWYLIGFAYWHVGQEVDVEFFTGDRTLRKVFVDRNNILYLNGKPYQEKTVIYFVQPNPPEENDLWYDTVTEILYIWRPNENGEWEWQPVNDLARGVTEVYQFKEAENPADLQTFDFKAHPNLFFMPGKHQLTVIVDQVVIMEDQYEELYYDKATVERLKEEAQQEGADKLYANLQKHLCGYGIRLNYPLERPSIVEIRVTHDLNTRNHETDLFAHDEMFIASGDWVIEDPFVLIYSAQCEFESGKAQLELYKNGIRLVADRDYKEVAKDGTDAPGTGALCNRFRLLTAPAIGDILAFRVLRQMSSYANLKAVVQEFENQVTECQEQTAEAVANFTEIDAQRQEVLADHTARIWQNESDIENLQTDKMDADIKIKKENLDSSIYDGIIDGQISIVKQTNALSLFLSNVRVNDLLQIAYAKNDLSDPVLLLKQRGDYALTETDGGVNLQLNGKWLNDANAKVYITGIRIGV